MLWSEIVALVEKQTDETYDAVDWAELINLCQDELTPLAKMLETKTGIAVTVTSGKTEITIANDTDLARAHRILNVYYTPTLVSPAVGKEVHLRRLQAFEPATIKGWKLDATKLYIQGLGTETAGTAKADFYKKLTHVVYSGGVFTPTVPEIPDEFHDIYVSFLCSKCQQREEELEDKKDFEADYKSRKSDFTILRIAQMEPWNLKYIAQSSGSGGGG